MLKDVVGGYLCCICKNLENVTAGYSMFAIAGSLPVWQFASIVLCMFSHN